MPFREMLRLVYCSAHQKQLGRRPCKQACLPWIHSLCAYLSGEVRLCIKATLFLQHGTYCSPVGYHLNTKHQQELKHQLHSGDTQSGNRRDKFIIPLLMSLKHGNVAFWKLHKSVPLSNIIFFSVITNTVTERWMLQLWMTPILAYIFAKWHVKFHCVLKSQI